MKIYLKLLLLLAALPFFLVSCDDDDDEPVYTGNLTVAFGTPTLKAMENVSPVQIAVVLSQPAPRDITVDVAVRREDGVKEGVDYTLRSHKITIPKGESGSYVELSIKDNLEVLPDRVIELQLVNASGATLAAETVSCRVTIISNEGYPLIGFAEALTSVDENAGEQEFKVTLTRPQNEDVVFHVEATDGTALNSVNYNLKLQEYTIPAGDTSTMVTVEIIDDIDVNDNRKFQLRITDATNAIISEIYATNDITILNDDRQAYASFKETQFKIIESDGEISIPVHLTGTPRKDIRVRIAVSSVSTAHEGKDYTLPESMVLEFPVGTMEQTLVIPILDNDEVDLTRTLNLTIDSVWNALPAEDNTFCTVTITNDDFDLLQLYEDLQGEWKITCTELANFTTEGTVTIYAGDNLQEENDNYLKRLKCKGTLAQGAEYEITWVMDYDVNTGSLSIPMEQIVKQHIGFGTVEGVDMSDADIRFWLLEDGKYVNGTVTTTWNKDRTILTWQVPESGIWGGIHQPGVATPPPAEEFTWFGFNNVTLTRAE